MQIDQRKFQNSRLSLGRSIEQNLKIENNSVKTKTGPRIESEEKGIDKRPKDFGEL